MHMYMYRKAIKRGQAGRHDWGKKRNKNWSTRYLDEKQVKKGIKKDWLDWQDRRANRRPEKKKGGR